MPDGFDYDAELRRYHARLWPALDIGCGDRVLDIGCGTGQTTRAAARAACDGEALGVDVSQDMLAEACELSVEEGLDNVRFECGDAESHPFPVERFSLGISRFGTMFFTDPAAAFANIARALRPGAPFVQLVWQDGARQEWASVIRTALDPGATESAGAEAAFSLADPATVRGVMTAGGFTDIEITELAERVCYGPDVAAARDSVLALAMATESLDHADDRIDHAVDRLEAVLQEYDTGDGVWFDSHAWLITARRISAASGRVSPDRRTLRLPAKI